VQIVSAGRLMLPEEVARTVAFCSSNASVNGSVFHINLGQKQLWYAVTFVPFLLTFCTFFPRR
jgi:hypothetical protein